MAKLIGDLVSAIKAEHKAWETLQWRLAERKPGDDDTVRALRFAHVEAKNYTRDAIKAYESSLDEQV